MENLTDYKYPTHVNAAFATQTKAERAYDELMYPLRAVFAGAGAGGLTDGIIGALMGNGM